MNTWNDAIYLIEQGYTLPQLKEMGDNEGAIVARNIKLLLNNGTVMVEPAKVQMNYLHLKPDTREKNYKNRFEYFIKAMYMTPKCILEPDYKEYYRMHNVRVVMVKNMEFGNMSLATFQRWWTTLKPHFVVKKSGGRLFFRIKDEDKPSLNVDPRGNSDEEVESYNRRYNARIEEEQNDFRKGMMLQEKEQTYQRPKPKYIPKSNFQCKGITTHGERCIVKVYHHNNDKDTLESLEKSKHRLHVNCEKTKKLCSMHCDCNYCGVMIRRKNQGMLYALRHTYKVEEPKVEEPKVEEPKVEEPKVDWYYKHHMNSVWANKPVTRHYYVWQCVQTHPSMRPLGRKDKKGCGMYNMRSSKFPLDGKNEVNGACNTCGRKKRLTTIGVSVLDYNNKKDALEKQWLLNDSRVEKWLN